MSWKLVETSSTEGRKEDLASGVARQLRHHFVALAAAGRPIGADGVDDGLCSLAFLDGPPWFVQCERGSGLSSPSESRMIALRTGSWPRDTSRSLSRQAVYTASVQRRAAAGAQAVDARFELVEIRWSSLPLPWALRRIPSQRPGSLWAFRTWSRNS